MIGAFKSIGIAADRYDKSRYDQYFDRVGLLLHCNGVNGSVSFPDSSSTAKTFTANGSAQVSTSQSKFGGASCRVTSAGSSFVSTPWNSSFGQLNAAAWTAECWARADGTASNGTVLACTQGGNSGFSIFQLGANWWTYINGYTSGTTIQGAAVTANQWVHLAASHDGTVCRFFCDGVLINSATVVVGNTTTAPFLVGGMNATNGWNSNIYFDGYVDDVRFTRGVARYTSNFTPPIYPFADLWNDSSFSSVGLLLHCDGANGSTSFPDSGPLGVSVTSNGGASVSTASPKFGTGALSLNGSGQNLSFQSSSFNVGSGAWTLEGWVNMNAGFTQYKRIFGYCAATPTLPSDESIILEVTQTTGTLGVYAAIGGAYTTIFDSVAISTGSWVHVAAVSTGSTLYLFKNGTLIGSTALSGAINFNAAWSGYIGKWPGSSLRDFSGFIDDFRFTKGVARYTSTFTPPALPFPNF